MSANNIVLYHESSARPAPISHIATVIPRCFNAAPWFESWDDNSAREFLTGILARRHDAFVLENGDRALGFGIGLPLEDYTGRNSLIELGADSLSYYLQGLAVVPESREHGNCTQFCYLLIDRAKQRGYGNMYVRTRFDNDVVIRIFRKIGFDEVGIADATTGGMASTRVVFRLEL